MKFLKIFKNVNWRKVGTETASTIACCAVSYLFFMLRRKVRKHDEEMNRQYWDRISNEQEETKK